MADSRVDRQTLKRRHVKVNKGASERRIASRQARVITGRKQTKEAVRREQDKAQQYLDLVSVIMVALDADGRVTLLNRKGCEVLGCSLEQALGKNWFDNFVPRPTRDSVRNVVRSLMTGEAASFEYYENPILTRGGEERWIAWHNSLLRNDQGAIVGTLSAGNDITETKRLEEELRKEEERWRTYVEDAADLIFTTDDTGKLASVNRAVCETTGFSAEELIGRNPLSSSRPRDRPLQGLHWGKCSGERQFTD